MLIFNQTENKNLRRTWLVQKNNNTPQPYSIMNTIKLCCSGLTVYEIPDALNVADIAIVEEIDHSGVWMIPPRSPKPWCKVVVKTVDVAKKIHQRYRRWNNDEKRAKRFGAAAFFETNGDTSKVLAKLEKIFPEIEREFV